MSYFAVEVKRISAVGPHLHSPYFEVYGLEGTDFLIVDIIDQYKEGDLVVYFPVDSTLPSSVSNRIGLRETFLGGQNHNIVRVCKIKGISSQGVIYHLEAFPEVEVLFKKNKNFSEDFSGVLGISKYNPPLSFCNEGEWISLPDNVEVYDIESCEWNPKVLQDLCSSELRLVVTEKVEGTNFSVTLNDQGEFFVNQRNSSIKLKQKEHTFWKVAREFCLEERCKKLLNQLKLKQVTLRGELIGPGIQGNYYRLEGYILKLFDIKCNEKYLNHLDFLYSFSILELKDNFEVPVLGVYEGKELLKILECCGGIKNFSQGISMINPWIQREGIVIKPCVEQETLDLRTYKESTNNIYSSVPRRLILKQRSPSYLSKIELIQSLKKS